MVKIDTDDVRHASEVITDVAAGLYGLSFIGYTPLQDMGVIDPTNALFGLVAVFAMVSLIGTATMISDER